MTSYCDSHKLRVMSMSSLGDLLTTREAAIRAKRTSRTIRRWVAAGRLTPTYTLPGVNGDHLFRAEDVDAACERRAS